MRRSEERQLKPHSGVAIGPGNGWLKKKQRLPSGPRAEFGTCGNPKWLGSRMHDFGSGRIIAILMCKRYVDYVVI